MAQRGPGRASPVLGALHPWRWWIALAVGAAFLLDVLVFSGHQLLWMLAWGIPLAFGLWFWGPILTGWVRAGARAGKAFRAGLNDQ